MSNARNYAETAEFRAWWEKEMPPTPPDAVTIEKEAITARMNEALTITKAEAQHMRRFSDAADVERMRKQDAGQVRGDPRKHEGPETVAMAEREIERRWRAFVKMVAIKAAIAATWIGAVLFAVWVCAR